MGAIRLASLLLLLGGAGAGASSVTLRAAAGARVNPIRKVVTMLQMMQNKVTEEGKKAEELYDKYMCYCSTADAETKIPMLESEIKESSALKEQLGADVEQAK